jgi:O-antigen ligase
MTERLSQPNVLIPFGLLGSAVLVGLLAGYDPRVALAAVLGGAFVILVVNDLTVGMGLMAFLSSLDGVPALGGGAISAPKLVGVLLGVSWIATLTARRDPQLLDRRPGLSYVLVLFWAWSAISLVWVEDMPEALDSLTRYAPNLILVAIAYAAVRSDRQLLAVVAAMIGGILVSALLSVLAPGAVTSDGERAAGLAGGANELGAAMVVGVVLCAALAATRWRAPLVRPTLVGGAALCMFALLLSLSRGGLVALGAALVTAILVAGRWRAKAIVAGAVLVVVAVVYFGAFASLPARERVLEVGGGTGRSDIWTVGARMVEDRPLLGVGAGNFNIASIHYLLEPGTITQDEFIISQPKVAHNTLLEVIAEIGIPGLVLFLGIVGASLLGMLRAARIYERVDDLNMEVMMRALFVATVGYLVAGLFISANYSKMLWLLIALGPAAQAVAGRRRRSSSST